MEQIKNLLPAEVDNLAPARQELKLQENFEFAEALKNQTIANSNLEELKEALRYIMVKVGLRAQNFPSEEEKGVLIAHILKNYLGHTPEEIKLAFDMAILRKLDLQEKEIPCYENFSCLYFSTIMNAYRIWAKQEYKHLSQEDSSKEIEHKEDMSDSAMEEWYLETCKRVRSGECKVDFIPLMLYEWKDRRGEIKKTATEKNEYLAKAVEFRYDRLLLECTDKPHADTKKLFESFSLMKEDGCFTGKEIDILKGLAKKMILYDIIKHDGAVS